MTPQQPILLLSLLFCAIMPRLQGAVAADADDSSTLQDVVVTANKRIETVQSTATSISVVGGQDLEDRGQYRLQDYADAIPGMNIGGNGAPGWATITLRGIAATSSGATVSTYIDDSPIGSSGLWNNAYAQMLDLLPYDVERLEVLRGPQGTLYGAGSLGGVVKYVMAAADVHDLSGKVGAESTVIDGGDGVGYLSRAMLNWPLIRERLGLRLSVYDDDAPGYVNNAFNGDRGINPNRQWGGRLALQWLASDALTLSFAWLDSHQTSDGLAEEQFRSAVQIPTNNGALIANLDAPYGRNTVYSYLPNTLSKDVDNIATTIDYSAGPVDVISATSWTKQRTDNTEDLTSGLGPKTLAFLGAPGGFSFGAFKIGYSKFSEELRLVSPQGARVEWLFGAFFTHESDFDNQYIYVEGSDHAIVPVAPAFAQPAGGTYACVFCATIPTTYQEAAVFGDATWNITPRWDLTGGLRYADNTQKFEATTTGNSNFLPPPPSIVSFGPKSEGVVTWSGSSRYRIAPDITLYARVASGYQPGGPNSPLPRIPSTVKSDTLISYEAGEKAEFFQRKLLVDLTAFYIDWTRIQIQAAQGNFGYTANGGAATSKGIELTAAYAPTARLRLGAALAYTDAVLNSVIPGNNFVTGYQLPGVPVVTAAVTMDYHFTPAAAWAAAIGGDVKWTDKEWFYVPEHAVPGDEPPTPTTEAPAYLMLNLYAKATIGHWILRTYARNVGNAHAAVFGMVSNGLTGGDWVLVQPRTVGLGFDFAF